MIVAHYMNHYTNLKVQTVSKMFARRLSVCCKVCIHAYLTVQKKPKSFFMYIELNFGSLLKTYFANLELTIGHLKVGKLKKTLSLCHYIG